MTDLDAKKAKEEADTWALKYGRELWSGAIDGREVRLFLINRTGLAMSVERLGLLAMDIREWWDAGVRLTALSGDDTTEATIEEITQEAKKWTH